MQNPKLKINLILLLIILLLITCSQKKSSHQFSDLDKVPITVSWDANRESAVNKTGGGYQVYFSKKQNFDISSAAFKDVPYESGSWSPVSTKLSLFPGTWYIKVVAYSSLGDGFSSEPSDEQTITIK